MNDSLVRAEGLSKAYGGVPVLRGIDLELRRGEVLGLLGPNGAGKTTTVRILTTLLRMDAGRASVAGHDVTAAPARVRRAIALTGQYSAVDEKLTGRENLRLLAGLFHLPAARRRGRVEELLDAFDLAEAADRLVVTYSGGMRRRLDLAAALLPRPQVLFLDEPTTGLDPRARNVLWRMIDEVVAAGTSVFLTTQYLEEADRLAGRIALIDDGRVVRTGTTAELKREVGNTVLELDLADPADVAIAAGIPGASVDPAAAGRVRVATDASMRHVGELLAHVVGLRVGVADWRLRTPSLDDVYFAATGAEARR